MNPATTPAASPPTPPTDLSPVVPYRADERPLNPCPCPECPGGGCPLHVYDASRPCPWCRSGKHHDPAKVAQLPVTERWDRSVAELRALGGTLTEGRNRSIVLRCLDDAHLWFSAAVGGASLTRSGRKEPVTPPAASKGARRQ